jgi:hypothetical protein
MKNTGINKEFKNWLTDNTADYDGNEKKVLEDLLQNGCVSGMVGKLIYYADTCRFYNKHRKEIFALVEDFCQQTGETLQDFLSHANNFPLSKDELANETFVGGISGLICKNGEVADQIKNWFAWFAFEEVARQYYSEKYEN